MTRLHTLCTVLLVCVTGGVSGVVLEPQNVAALLGSDARFNCSLEGSFKVMAWLVNNNVVLTISMQYGVLDNSPHYSATNYSSGATQRWEFVTRNVQRNDSGAVTCDVQNIQKKTGQLSVQESGSVSIVGGNVTVIRGAQASFSCAALGWFPAPALTWVVNGSEVDAGLYNSSTVASGSLFNSTSVLTLVAAVSAAVECRARVPAQSAPLSSVIYMVVEAPKPTDWTVLIAVVCSVGGAALLLLLILLILLCCRRRRQANSSYEEEMRRARAQTQLSVVSGSRPKQGQANLGYVTDGQTSLPPTDSGLGPVDVTNIFAYPDVVRSNQSANVHVQGNTIKQHRHLTIV